jgi:hypothetical protein
VSTEELLAEALRLPRPELAQVAEQLLSSLEESDDEVAVAWASELEQRSQEVAEGRVRTDRLGDRPERYPEGALTAACGSNCTSRRALVWVKSLLPR